jgi:lipid-binding SYLF domain-containing protein
MKRREILLAAGAAIAATGCATSTSSGGGGSDPGAKRREIDAGVDNALSQLYTEEKGSRELASKARAILVFPKVVTAGLVVGGSYGEGALREGTTTAGYYSISAGSVGLLAGAQSKAMYLLFMTDSALSKFKSSNGWTAGADASVGLAKMSADARLDAEVANKEVLAFVRSNAGFMANLSVDGTKVSKLQI